MPSRVEGLTFFAIIEMGTWLSIGYIFMNKFQKIGKCCHARGKVLIFNKITGALKINFFENLQKSKLKCVGFFFSINGQMVFYLDKGNNLI